MKGYSMPNGYMGYVQRFNKYILFSTEEDYLDYIA